MWFVTDEDRAFLAYVQAHAEMGYGRMMQIISHEWFRHDPNGAQIANTCYGLLPELERAKYAAFAEGDLLFQPRAVQDAAFARARQEYQAAMQELDAHDLT